MPTGMESKPDQSAMPPTADGNTTQDPNE